MSTRFRVGEFQVRSREIVREVGGRCGAIWKPAPMQDILPEIHHPVVGDVARTLELSRRKNPAIMKPRSEEIQ
jgi:hypothetical protein